VELDPSLPGPWSEELGQAVENELKQMPEPHDGPCDDCRKDAQAYAFIGLGIGIIIGGAAYWIMSK
jgi:hypothetical protein